MKCRAVFILLLALSATARAEKTKIEVPLFEGGNGKDFYLEAAREYERVRPDIEVDLYLDPRIEDKIRVRVLEGSFFEITNAFINYWPLIHTGKVLCIDEALNGPNWEGDATWRDSFLPGALEAYTDDNGKVYGVPFGYYAFVMWYNKEMFREHGWAAPKTWDELFALCEQVKKTGIAPFAFQGRYSYYAEPLYEAAFYHLAGYQRWRDQKLLIPGSFNCPESVRSLEIVQKIAKDYFQKGALGMSHTESQLEFFLGHTAMIPCGAWLKSEMKGKIPDGFELGSFNMPAFLPSKGDPTAVNVHVEPYFVMAKSAHPREAIDFLRFMTSRKMAGRFSRLQDIPTAIRGANEGNLESAMQEMMQIVLGAKTSYGAVPGEKYPEFEQVYRDVMYRAISSMQTPQQIAQYMEASASAVKRRGDNPDDVTVQHRTEPAILLGALGFGLIVAVWSMAKSFRSAASAVRVEGLQRLNFSNVLLFVGPAVAIYTLFVIIPSLRSFAWSLRTWSGLTDMREMPFKGLLNFRRLLLESDAFWIALRNNLFLMIAVPVFVVPLALFLAASISRNVWGSKLFRVVFFFPNLLGGVAATLLWLHVYNPQGGLVNGALVAIGFKSFAGFAWLEPKNLYWSLIPISIWGACGFNMVLYLAAMETIPESYYEASRIDGAGAWRQFWTITLPLMWEVLAISLVFLVIGGMKAFEVIWLLTNQQPQTQNHVASTLMIQTMFTDYKVGEATAIAVLLFVMIFIISAAMLRGMRRERLEI